MESKEWMSLLQQKFDLIPISWNRPTFPCQGSWAWSGRRGQWHCWCCCGRRTALRENTGELDLIGWSPVRLTRKSAPKSSVRPQEQTERTLREGTSSPNTLQYEFQSGRLHPEKFLVLNIYVWQMQTSWVGCKGQLVVSMNTTGWKLTQAGYCKVWGLRKGKFWSFY